MLAAGWLGACLAEIGHDTEAERLLVESLAVLQVQGFKEGDRRICRTAEQLADFYRPRSMKKKLHPTAFPSCQG